jgi:hypothetical protein
MNAQGYAIYVRDAFGNDSMYASAFRDQMAATIDIADHTDKSVYIITFDAEGRRGCPGEAVAVTLSGAEPGPGPQLPPALNLSAVPNPYSDQTTIGFALASPSSVKIQVHDLNGKEVATVTERQFEAGDHTLNWNAGDLPAGMYVISITAGERSEALVTILVR